MEKTVKERIMMFLKSKNITKSAFEKSIGLSNGYMSRLQNSPSIDKLSKILEVYPELNKTWLLAGEGNMLNDNSCIKYDSPSDGKCISNGKLSPEEKRAMIKRIINHYSSGNVSDFAKRLDVDCCVVDNWIQKGEFDNEQIYVNCPDLSSVWLLTGKGNMFCEESQEIDRVLAEIEFLKGKLSAYECIMKAKGVL